MADQKREECASKSSCSRSSCEGCPSHQAGNAKPDFHEDLNPYSSIKHVIGIVSGKGGVGKSFVTGQMASMLVKAGYKVGILDADITGPSIPKMYGVHGPCVGDERGTFPAVAEDGTKIMSINLILEREEDPVIWRGPVIAGAVKQFWTDIAAAGVPGFGAVGGLDDALAHPACRETELFVFFSGQNALPPASANRRS